jgi:hypothetical protein
MAPRTGGDTGTGVLSDRTRCAPFAVLSSGARSPGSGASVDSQDWASRMWELAAQSSAYAPSLVEEYGEEAARVFAVGCDIIGDQIKDDLDQLRSMPRGTHIGEAPASWLDGQLPPQWLMRYDYDFLFRLRATVEAVRLRAVHPSSGPFRVAPRSDFRSTRSRAAATTTPRTRGCRSLPPSTPCSTRLFPGQASNRRASRTHECGPHYLTFEPLRAGRPQDLPTHLPIGDVAV